MDQAQLNLLTDFIWNLVDYSPRDTQQNFKDDFKAYLDGVSPSLSLDRI